MTNRSTSQKVLQSFYVRAGLWKLFERRSKEMDCSVDYLINEAMRLYAIKHGFIERRPGTEDSRSETGDTMGERASIPSAAPARQAPSAEAQARSGPGQAKQRYPSQPGLGTTLPRPRQAVGTPVPSSSAGPSSGRASAPPPLPRPSGAGASSGGYAPAAGQQAPMRQTGQGPGARSHSDLPVLTLVFQGRKIPIQTEQFIIGRGSKSSDLAIKDANISRKHAAIIYHNGAYYMKDLGSTNGIEFRGKQVDSKRIDEGDVFSVCGYEIQFTYAG